MLYSVAVIVMLMKIKKVKAWHSLWQVMIMLTIWSNTWRQINEWSSEHFTSWYFTCANQLFTFFRYYCKFVEQLATCTVRGESTQLFATCACTSEWKWTWLVFVTWQPFINDAASRKICVGIKVPWCVVRCT